MLHVRLGAGIRVEQAELTPGLAATLRHAASMHNPLFYERQRMRASTWNIPRFPHSYEETIDGSLILPRSMLGIVTDLAAQAGSRLEVTDERTPGNQQEFTLTAALTITLHVGPVRHTIILPHESAGGIPVLPGSAPGGRPDPVLHVHPTGYRYTGDVSLSAPGGITVICKDLIADEERTRQVTADVRAALARGRNCLVLTNWTARLDTLASALRDLGHDPVILRGGMGAKDRMAALARLQP